MTRMGKKCLKLLGNGRFVPGSFRRRAAEPGKKMFLGPATQTKYIVHFPEDARFGLMEVVMEGMRSWEKMFCSTNCLRHGRDEGWLAEHMLILGITNPEGEKKYFAAAFPSACGKTNLAMLTPTLPGWKIETVGDDIAWMKFGQMAVSMLLIRRLVFLGWPREPREIKSQCDGVQSQKTRFSPM